MLATTMVETVHHLRRLTAVRARLHPLARPAPAEVEGAAARKAKAPDAQLATLMVIAPSAARDTR